MSLPWPLFCHSVCLCVCVCCLGGLCEHKFKGFGDVGSCVQDYWLAVEFRMLQSYLITYKLECREFNHIDRFHDLYFFSLDQEHCLFLFCTLLFKKDISLLRC